MREKAIVETNTEYKIKLRFIVLTIFLVLFYTTLLFSATIYIDPTNTAGNQNGTITNPYNSWNNINFINGNSYLQKRGTTFNTSGGISLTNRSNITLGAYGTGAKPIIRSSSQTARIIRLTNSSNCIVRDLEVTSTVGILGPVAFGIDGTSANNLIDSCLLYNCEYGFSIFTEVGIVGNRILNTIIHTTGDDGIYAKDLKNIEIGFCHIYNVNRKYLINPDQSYSAGDCIQLVGNQSVANGLVVNIHDNILDHSSMGNKFCMIIVGDYYSGTISNNDMTAGNSTSCIYLWHTTGSIIVKNNTLQNGTYGIYSYVHDLQLQYNKIMNNDVGIMVLPSALTLTSLTAYNNVFYNNSSSCIAISTPSSTLISKNNSFFLIGNSAKAYSTGTSNVVSNFNNFNIQQGGFINNFSTLSSWRSASGNDMNSFVANPMFVNPAIGNFMLQTTSPCINTGTSVNLQFDYFGTQVPQGNMPDIGIHEYLNNQGGTNLTPVINNQNFQINENSANGTIIGSVVANDPNSGQTLTYSITGGNTNNAFAINTTSGVLSVANSQAVNFEASPSFPLTVRVTDNGTGNLWSQAIVTVNLINLNENPAIGNQSFSATPNASNGTIIGLVIASDPDQGQTLSYSITGGNTGNAFTINPGTGRITVANSSAVVPGSFYLTVRATDNGSPVLWSAATITITVSNSTNLAPVISNQSFSVVQNSPNGTLVGTVVASDPNSGQTLTYSIVSGNTNTAFSINPVNGNITVNNSTALLLQTFLLTVRVTDNGSPNLYSQAIVTIIVITPPNQAPIIANQSFSTTLNSPNGTLIGTVVASDPNAGQTLNYSITGGNPYNIFSINSSNGNLTINNSSAITIQSYALTVRVTDNGFPSLWTQATITILVTPTNSNQSPVIANQSFYVVQYAPNGTLVGHVVASDPNSGQNIAYSIISGNPNNTFSINANTGNIVVNNSNNLSFQTFYLIVRVTDNGTPSLFSQATVTIDVVGPSNQAPEIEDQSFNLVQFSPNGTLVGLVVASDPDSGQILTYSIISGNTNNTFLINSATGNIIVNNSSALSPQLFSLIVRVTDNGSPSQYSQALVTINVILPPNQAPVITNQTFSIESYSTNGSIIGTVLASDLNAGQVITYSIVSGNTNGVVSINSLNGILTVSNSTALVPGTLSITVRATDNGIPALWSQGVMTINVVQSMNQSPIIANQSFTIDENSSNGTFIGNVIALDPDQGQTLTYSIISGNTNSAFSINSTNGSLLVNNSMAVNYEYFHVFSLLVRVTDNGSGNLWSQATVSVNINDLNEMPMLNPWTFNVTQNAPGGTFVGIITGSDPDPGQSVTFQILSGNTSNAFNLNPNTGSLNVVNSSALNINVNPSFFLTVKIQDNGQPSLFSTGIIRIDVVANKQGDEIVNDISSDGSEYQGYTIYPNPSSDGIFNIKSISGVEKGEIHVFNIAGKLIETFSTSSESNTVLNISDQPDGMYILKITSEKGSYDYKAIKQ